MKLLPIVLIFVFTTTYSCDSTFDYDPSKAYPILETGDYWIDKFNQGGLQNARIFGDRLFCNTINITKGQDFLYCLSLITGKVIWRIPVKWYASQPVVIYNHTVYFSTILGDIYKITLDGKLIWEQKLPSPYAGHTINPQNGNLLVNTVADGTYEFKSETGEISNHYPDRIDITDPYFTQPTSSPNSAMPDNTSMDTFPKKEGYPNRYTIDKNGVKYEILIQERINTTGLNIVIKKK